jgi:hypothetical protein
MSAKHIEARNALNELGLTREEVTRIIEARVDKLVSQWASQDSLKKLIDKRVAQILDEKTKEHHHDWQSVRHIVGKAAEDYVRKHLSVSFAKPEAGA